MPICEYHKVPTELYEDGDGETGPLEPYEDCPKCREERNSMECEVCGRLGKIVQRRLVNVPADPTECVTLDCGHTFI